MDSHERYWGLRDSGEPSELSWGSGLTPRHARYAAPADGGYPHMKTPPMGPERSTGHYHQPAQQVRT